MNEPSSKSAGQNALEALLAGNRRHVEDVAEGRYTPDWNALVAGQSPIATVLSCADSRVGPEIIFDQPQGRLFVVRNAGYVLDTATIATIEYGLLVLQTPLLIVMGHTGCGAVAAALDQSTPAGALGKLVEQVRASIRSACNELPNDASVAELAHVGQTAHSVRQVSPPIAELVGRSGPVLIAPLIYHLATGAVTAVEATTEAATSAQTES